MWKANGGGLEGALGGMIRDIASCGFVLTFVGSCVIYDAFAVF